MNDFKRFKPYFSLISLGVCALLMVSCAQDTVKPGKQAAATQTPQAGTQNASQSATQAATQAKTISKVDRDKYKKGITALFKNELAKAQRIFIEFIRAKPTFAGGYSNLALIYFKQEKYQQAEKQIDKALSLNPKQAPALNLKGQLLIKRGKVHEAKTHYLLAIKHKANYANAQYNLALLYDVYFQDIPLAIMHYKHYMLLLKKPDDATKQWIKHLEGTLKNA